MNSRKAFFKKLRDEGYTILVPDMCPIHFAIMTSILNRRGYKMAVVTPHGRGAKDAGLSAVHNDSCYPVIVTCGAFIEELRTGKHDLNKTAVIISQTGGGCRASNYLSLFKKALAKEFPTVPVISLNFSGLEKERSLPLDIPTGLELYRAVLYGDFIQNLYNQSLAYYPRDLVDEAKKDCIKHVVDELGTRKYRKEKPNYLYFLERFSSLQPFGEKKPRVGIVGEIYVKYSAYANNNLGDFLVANGTEAVFPSLNEFLLYYVYNTFVDYSYYGRGKKAHPVFRLFYKYALRKTRKTADLLKGTTFLPYEDFEDIVSCGKEVIDSGVKMGEGWLIPSEMVCFARHDVKNIVVVQPFGCLPNHIVGKGMVRAVKEVCPEANIVPLDFDASSTSVNQENRLKLMLSNLA